jgi:Zn-dependent peptidase ImmA (M78 family)
MKKYQNINTKAERIATEAYEDSGDRLPSIFSLIKWTEEIFGVKMEIKYSNEFKEGHAGLVYWDPEDYKYKIWLNSKEPERRQRFTLCHEIGHIIKSSDLKYGLSDGDIYSNWGEERFCNRFAAAFLMPAEVFIRKWEEIDEPLYSKKVRLVGFFDVSGEAIYYRAKELDLIK